MAIDPHDLANWIANTDTGCQAVQTRHHFDKENSTEEADFLENSIIQPSGSCALDRGRPKCVQALVGCRQVILDNG